MARVLLVGMKQDLSNPVSQRLEHAGHNVTVATEIESALLFARGGMFDLVLVGQDEGERSALHLLRALKRESSRIAVVIMAEQGTIESAVEAIRLGAKEYLTKPREPGEVVAVVEKALVIGEPVDHAEWSRESDAQCGQTCGVIGVSPAIRGLMELVKKVAETDSTVLITGETGTGKELVGSAIHKLGPRAGRAFSVVNSAAFPEMLLESELFGYRRGALTGASSDKKGLLEYAHRGTVFLDEVAELPLSMQAKLLRFLQTGELRPVGGESTRYVDVRLMAATKKDLEREVSEGRFREDLYYRLAVIPLQVPPLRERMEDIPLLVEHFLRRFAERLGRPVVGVDAAAMDLLMRYSWPGNVRQLENSIEGGVALCRGREITVDELPVHLREASLPREGETIQSLQVMERAHILATLDRVGWNRKCAAELLQISTTTLWRRLKEFGVESKHDRRMPPPPAPRS